MGKFWPQKREIVPTKNFLKHIKNGKNGFIFKNGNAQDLANKIVKIVKNKKRLEKFKLESINIISKWDFNSCYFGLKKSIKCVQKIN